MMSVSMVDSGRSALGEIFLQQVTLEDGSVFGRERFHVKGTFSIGSEVHSTHGAKKAFVLITDSAFKMFRS